MITDEGRGCVAVERTGCTDQPSRPLPSSSIQAALQAVSPKISLGSPLRTPPFRRRHTTPQDMEHHPGRLVGLFSSHIITPATIRPPLISPTHARNLVPPQHFLHPPKTRRAIIKLAAATASLSPAVLKFLDFVDLNINIPSRMFLTWGCYTEFFFPITFPRPTGRRP